MGTSSELVRLQRDCGRVWGRLGVGGVFFCLQIEFLHVLIFLDILCNEGILNDIGLT